MRGASSVTVKSSAAAAGAVGTATGCDDDEASETSALDWASSTVAVFGFGKVQSEMRSIDILLYILLSSSVM